MLLGGMAKQVVVVMPVALILLDVWPLGRTSWGKLWRDAWRLAAEKWAFWLLSAVFVFLAVWTQASEQAISAVPFGHRLKMIPLHYLFYLQKTFWPSALAPLQDDLPLVVWQAVAGLTALAGITALLWRWRAKAPWALWGWLWFVGLIFPLSGVVWTGSERVAVRFTYLPHIGLAVAVALAVDAWGRRFAAPTSWVRAFSVAVLLFCAGATVRMLSYWRDPNVFGLWIYECHPQQGGACAMGGDVFMATGEWAKAIAAFEQGAELGDKACFARLGMVMNHLGHARQTAAAWAEFEQMHGQPLTQFAFWERPVERELLWRVRGQALRAVGDYPGAIAALAEAVRWEPDPGALVVAEFLRACHEGGHPEEGAAAAERMAQATGIRVREWRDLFPCYVEIWKMGARGHAYGYFADFAARFPENGIELNYMAWLLATAEPDGLDHARKEEWPQAALNWANRALELSKEPPAGVWHVLAAARANAGDFSGAVRAAETALDLARKQKEDLLAEMLEKQILGYRMGLSWRE